MDAFTLRHRSAAAEASRDYKTGRGPATAAALDALDRLGARVDAELTDAVARKYYPALFEIDVAQDGKPLGRLQHPDDRAEIERLRAEVEQLRNANASLGKHFDQRVDALARRSWLPEDD